MRELPIIDLSPLREGSRLGKRKVADELHAACTDRGFFFVIGHGVDSNLEQKLEQLSQSFFAQPEAKKMEDRMAKAGLAWRGYFPVGGELTSGKPDWKEGLYFGQEHQADHPAVLSGTPLHGANLFPQIEGFKETVLAYMYEMRELGHRLMEGMALSLGLEETYFRQHFTHEPTELFRIFHYPPPPKDRDVWGVGEHTDYGLLTILKQDDVGGLEVKSRDVWLPAPPLAGSFVCNIGDMLDRLTKGLYRSTPHRVMNRTQRERYSYPYFFDPNFNAQLLTLPLGPEMLAKAHASGAIERWDRLDVQAATGSYGEYLLAKVGKVFPNLK